MTQAEFRGNGTVFSVGATEPLEVDRDGVQLIATPPSWFDQVASHVRVAASTNEAISAAFVSKDGRRVVVSAPDWTEALSRAGAALIASLLRELKPDASHWIEGGFTPGLTEAPEGSVCVHRRTR